MVFIQRYSISSFLVLLAGIYTTCFLLVNSTQFLQNADALAFGITADLTIVIPVLYYFLVVRTKKAPAISLVPVFLLSLVLASLLLPGNHHTYLNMVKLLVAPAEIFAVGYIIWKVNNTVKAFRQAKSRAPDFYESLSISLRQTLGNNRAADVFASEIATFYFAFFSWRKEPLMGENERAFSYYRECGWPAVMAIVCLMVVVETIAIHLLLQNWSVTAAWIFTALSIYSIFWLIGDFNAMRLRPILLSGDTLRIRIGLRWTLNIPCSEIESLQPIKEIDRKIPGLLNAVVFGEPQFLLTLKNPLTASGFFGLSETVNQIVLAVDEGKEFEAALKSDMQEEI